MDNPRIGSLNSLADYGLGESDIEDSDEEVESKDNEVKPIALARPYVAQPRVTSSKRDFVNSWRKESILLRHGKNVTLIHACDTSWHFCKLV